MKPIVMIPARRRLRGVAVSGVLIIAMMASGCEVFENALEVEAPSQVPAAELDRPEHAQLLVNGAIGDFECALGSYVVNSGLLGGELDDATFTADRWPLASRSLTGGDRRYSVFGCDALGVYTPLSTARWSADNILEKLNAWTDAEVTNRQRLIATAAAYSGYAHLLLGEGFCTAAINMSAELSSEQVFQRAEERFTQAITAAQAASDNDILNMARVGRARARLNLGKRAEAAADARLVSASYVKLATASTSSGRRRNRVSEQNRTGSVSVRPEYRNLTVGGIADPRVAVVDAGRNGADAQTRLWFQRKYTDDAAPLPIATWEEAQLIIAEAEGGQSAVSIINALRARAGLPATFASTNSAEIQAAVLEERRRELFLEGQRLYDVRRLSLSLVPAPGAPYPKGGTYGDARCMPLPDVERATNPNL